MPKYQAKGPDGETYRTDTGAESYSNEELMDMLRDWLASPNGRVETSFNMLKQGADPLKGASKVARSLSAGDNPYANLSHDEMTAMMAGNAGGMVAGLSPVWGPAVPPLAAGAARYGAGAAALGAAEHFAPDSIKDYVRDFILLKMLGHR